VDLFPIIEGLAPTVKCEGCSTLCVECPICAALIHVTSEHIHMEWHKTMTNLPYAEQVKRPGARGTRQQV
jgi:hypothetical protein